MKKYILTVLLISVFITGQTQTKNFIDQPYIEVNGNADTLITPNEIFIKIVISEKDTKDKVSVEESELKMVNALKALGIDTEKDLTTNDMSSNFRSYLLKGKDVLKTKQYILKVKDALTASKVFIQLEELGISNTSIDRVDHSDLDNIRNLMRVKAVSDAKARAVALTKPLNQSVGAAIHITDLDVNNLLQGRLYGVSIRGAATFSKSVEELPKIEFEKIKVAANTSVTFILR